MISKLAKFSISTNIAGLGSAATAFIVSIHLIFLSNEFNTKDFLGAGILILLPVYLYGISLFFIKNTYKKHPLRWCLILYAMIISIMYAIISKENFIYQTKTLGIFNSLMNNLEFIIYLAFPVYFCVSTAIREIIYNKNT